MPLTTQLLAQTLAVTTLLLSNFNWEPAELEEVGLDAALLDKLWEANRQLEDRARAAGLSLPS